MKLFIILVVAWLLLFVVYKLLNNKSKKQIMNIKQSVDSIPLQYAGFKTSQSIYTPLQNKKLAIDNVNKRIAIKELKDDNKRVSFVYDFKEVLMVEILENGNTVTSTSRTSQIGGALVGGALLGGTGAIIGGLSGKTKSVEEISTIELKIVVDDLANPFHIIRIVDKMFDNDNKNIKKGTMKYEELMKKVYHWHSLLEVAVREDKVVSPKVKKFKTTVHVKSTPK